MKKDDTILYNKNFSKFAVRLRLHYILLMKV